MILLFFLAYFIVGLILTGVWMRLCDVKYEGGEEVLAVFGWPLLIVLALFMGVILATGWMLEKISGKKSTPDK